MVRRTQGQDGNKDADLLENGLEDTGRGKGKLGQSESGMDIYTLPNVKEIASSRIAQGDQLGAL